MRFSWASSVFFFQPEDAIGIHCVPGVQTCALPIYWFLNCHGITATTIYKPIRERMIAKVEEDTPGYNAKSGRGHGSGHGQKLHTSQTDARHPQMKQTKNLIQLSKGEFFDLNALDVEALTPDDKKKLS